MDVRLTWPEVEHAVLIGAHRQIRHKAKNTPQRYGCTDTGWTMAIEACAAEMAVAKFLGRYFGDTIAPDRDGDVGLGVQVRHTTREDGRLIVHPQDNDVHLFVLVRGCIPTFDLAGWIMGSDAKQPRYWDSTGDRPAYFVGAHHLLPCEQLWERHARVQ